MKNLNNTTRGLTLSFCLLMAIFFMYGVYSIYEVRHISSITRTIYSRPLVVSNAALHAKASITKMHLNMKDVVLTHYSSKSQQYIEAVNEEEELVYRQLNIIKKNILGDDGKALESAARKLFDEWRPIRNGVIELVKQNQIENAANITIGAGANHVVRLNTAIAKLTNFALDKASLFVAQVDYVNDKTTVITIGFLLISITMAGLVALLAIKKTSAASDAWRESVERYRALIINLDAGVVVHAPDTSIVMNNPKALELLGLSDDEIKGKVAIDPEWKFINEDNTPLPFEDYPVNRVITSKKPIVTQILGIHRSETKDIVWVTVNGFPMLDSTGNLSEIVISFFDVTERKQAEVALRENEAKFRGLVESSSDLIWEVNQDGVYNYVSPQIEDTLGYRPEEVLGKTPFDFMSPEESELIKAIFISFIDEGISIDTLENINLHKDKSLVYLETSGVPILDEAGKVIGFRGVDRDITKRKMDEKELQSRTDELFSANNELMNHKENLLELVDERTKELNESLDKLTRTQDYLVQTEKMAALGGLVAGIAHEINTPVGVCVTAASFLDDKTKEFAKMFQLGHLENKDYVKYIDLSLQSSKMILINMERAASLIQSFKQVAVDQSCKELRKFKIKHYISEILVSVHSKFKKTPYEIVVNCPQEFSINGYPGVISQIITNLLMNSLIHGFEGCDRGTITIEAHKVGENVNIIYQDTGCGISEESLNHIYDPFFTTKRGQGGSGLGLHIVYNLITQTLNGEINCSSTIGKGTRFELDFPSDLGE